MVSGLALIMREPLSKVCFWPTVAGWLPGDSGPNAAVLVLDAPPLDIDATIPPC